MSKLPVPRLPATIIPLRSLAARNSRTGQCARLLGAIVTGKKTNYYIRMVGPDKTMKKLKTDFDEMVKTIKLEEEYAKGSTGRIGSRRSRFNLTYLPFRPGHDALAVRRFNGGLESW